MPTRVDKETAIKLKELGYNLGANKYYSSEDDICRDCWAMCHISNQVLKDSQYSAPYTYDVVDWLDTLGLYCETTMHTAKNTRASVWDSRCNSESLINGSVIGCGVYDKRNIAILACVVHALERLKTTK